LRELELTPEERKSIGDSCFCRSTAVSNLFGFVVPTFSTLQHRRADKNKNPPIDFRSSGVNSSSRNAFSASTCALHFSSAVFSISRNRITLLLQIFIQTLQPPRNLVVIRKASAQDPDSSRPAGINTPLRMWHRWIIKHTNHMRNHVHFAQLCQRIAHALLLHPAQIHIIHRPRT